MNPYVTFLRIYFENLTVITCLFSGVNFKKELPNEGLIKASKCKTCEVEDGSIRTDPETGEEKKVKLERCAKWEKSEGEERFEASLLSVHAKFVTRHSIE